MVGYPVDYPYYAQAYGYSYPYSSASPYAASAYPYAVPGPTYGYGSPSAPAYPYAVAPPAPSTEPPASGALQDLGGLSFDITPADAQVLVDGQAVGIARSFSPSSQPLTVAPGRHHVEIRASGYRSVAFDVDSVAGEVTPYYGTLER